MYWYSHIGTDISLEFSQTVYVVDEDDGSVDICMELSGLPSQGLECDLVIPLILVNGSAGDGP